MGPPPGGLLDALVQLVTLFNRTEWHSVLLGYCGRIPRPWASSLIDTAAQVGVDV